MTTLREKIGQMMVVGIEGEALTFEERAIIEEYSFGGFILFGRNCRAPKQILSLCRALWEIGAELPPLIAIDQEGGRVHRLPKPFTHFPSAALIGRSGDIDLAYRAGRAAAAELALLGINLNFAPVLDVDSNPSNPVIADRSFGSRPRRVIDMSSAWMRGLKDGGIIPCGKHFPGHGDTDKDSHLDLPVVEKTLTELKAVELPPFAQACQSGIEALMTAHVLYRALDPELPATLSERIITGLLRQELGYDGVVFSDDMEMQAIGGNYGAAEAAALALRAGVDVLLFGHESSRVVQVFECLCAEVEKEPALRARVAESYRRITRLKHGRLRTFTGADERKILTRLAALDHQRIVDEIQGSL